MAELLEVVASPYPGLRPFETDEAHLFYGREAHVDRMLDILQRERFLAVIGPSGSGKSSLVNAGLLPGVALGGLGTGIDWRVVKFRPGDQPISRLAEALLEPLVLGQAVEPNGSASVSESEAAPITAESELRRGPLGLLHLVQSARRAAPPEAAAFNLLVVVDQFEELFTYADAGRQQANESEAFVNLLLNARGDTHAQVYAVLTMRTDFLGNCVRFLDLPEAINSAQYLTPRLKRNELERAICGPAEQFGGQVDALLLAELINATGADSDQLPLVQHALSQMWRRHAKPGEGGLCRIGPDSLAAASDIGSESIAQPKLTDSLYGAHLGSIHRVLDLHADRIFEHELKDERQRALAEGLFRHITEQRTEEAGGQAVRRPRELALIAEGLGCSWQELVPIVQRFAAADACMLQYGKRLEPSAVIDLTHEALMRHWRRLRGWLANEAHRAAEFRVWRQAAREKEAGTRGLLAGPDLVRALEWSGRQTQSAPHSPGAQWVPDTRWALRHVQLPLGHTVGKAQASTPKADQRHSLADEQLRLTLSYIEESHKESDRLVKEARDNAEIELRKARKRVLGFSVLSLLAVAASVVALVFFQKAEFKAKEALVAKATALENQGKATAAAERADKAASAAEKARADATLSATKFELAAAKAESAASAADAANLLATRQRNAALQLARRARIGELAAASQSALAQGDPERALLLAHAGLSIGKESISGMAVAFQVAHHHLALVALRHEGRVLSVAFSANGRSVVTTSSDNPARVWDADKGSLQAELKGDGLRVKAAAISADGRRVVTASADNTARVWDAEKGSLLAELKGHEGGVMTAAISADGRRAFTSSDGSIFRVWDADNGSLLAELKGHGGRLYTAAFSTDGLRLVTTSSDNTARVWDTDKGLLLAELNQDGRGLTGAAISADGRRVVTTSSDYIARVWDAAKGLLLAELKGHVGRLNSAAFSADGRRVVTASSDNTSRVWDADRGSLLAELKGHRDTVNIAAISADGRRVVTASSDNTARLWDADKGSLLAELKGDGRKVEAVAISADGRRVVTAGSGNTARVWEADNGLLLAELEGHVGRVNTAASSADGRRVLTVSSDKTARVWDADKGLLLAEIKGRDRSAVSTAAISADGRRVVTASSDNIARVWDAAKGSLLVELEAYGGTRYTPAISADGSRVVTITYDKKARVWDAAKGSLLAELKGHGDQVHMAAFNSDGRRVVTAAGFDDTALVWDADKGLLLAKLKGHVAKVNTAAFSADGRRVVTASSDNTARVWDAEKGSLLAELKGRHGSAVDTAAISADGLRVVMTSFDKTARVWDVDKGSLLAEIKGQGSGVEAADISADGRRVVTASSDNTARVWDADNGLLLGELKGHVGQVNTAAFSDDGRRVVTASRDNTARVWDVTRSTFTRDQLKAWMQQRLQALGLEFSDDECKLFFPPDAMERSKACLRERKGR